MSMRTVLITGGAGFIGSNLVAAFSEAGGWDVIVCDRLRDAASGKWRNLAKHPVADIVTPEALFDWLRARGDDLDLVVHMGAISSTMEPDVDRIFANNFRVSRDLYAWCVGHGKRLVYASSAATYGDGRAGFDDDPSLEALSALRPLNAYGWSKALFDVHVARERLRGRTPPQCVGLKFFNVYGPNEGHKGAMRSVVNQIWPKMVADGQVSLFKSYRPEYPDGGQMRDFVYVRDIGDCVLWLAEAPGVQGLFNFGSGRARTFLDLAHAVFAAAGRPPRVDFIDMPEVLRAAYQYHTEAPMARLRQAGWAGESTGLEAGVADYVGRYLSQNDAYR